MKWIDIITWRNGGESLHKLVWNEHVKGACGECGGRGELSTHNLIVTKTWKNDNKKIELINTRRLPLTASRYMCGVGFHYAKATRLYSLFDFQINPSNMSTRILFVCAAWHLDVCSDNSGAIKNSFDSDQRIHSFCRMCRNSSQCFQCNKYLFDQFSLAFESTTPSSRHPFLAPHFSTFIFSFSLHNSSQAATFSHSTETSHIFCSLSTYGRALRLQIEKSEHFKRTHFFLFKLHHIQQQWKSHEEKSHEKFYSPM